MYLEAYTAILPGCGPEQLESLFHRKVVIADRDMVESGEIIKEVETKKVVLLVVGDPFSATTHSDLVTRCHALHVPVEVVHNASILTAVGVCGLQLYRFGQVISLCFWTETWRPDSWYERLLSNRREGLHTLVLLDIKVKEISNENLARGKKIYEPPRFMTVNQAVEQLLAVESQKGQGALTPSTMACGLARVGSPTQKVVVGPLQSLRDVDFGGPLHSLVVCGDIHECEVEHLSMYSASPVTVQSCSLHH